MSTAIATAAVAIVVVCIAHLLTYLCNERSLLYLALPRLPKLLFCSNRRLRRRPQQFWAFDTASPDWLTTSYFVPIWVLAALRLLIGIYFGVELLVEGFTTRNGLGSPGYVWLSFFTDWSFMVYGFAGLFGFGVTLWHMILQRRDVKVQPDVETAAPEQSAVAAAATPRKWTAVEAFYLLVFETSAASALFLTVFYWVALAGDGGVSADNLLKHGVNNVMILLDVMLSRVPFLSYHFHVALIYGTVYLIFMWAVWLPVENYWVYSVFDWSRWRSLGAYAVLPVALFVSWLVWTGFAALREVLGRRFAVRRWSTAINTSTFEEQQVAEQMQCQQTMAQNQQAQVPAGQETAASGNAADVGTAASSPEIRLPGNDGLQDCCGTTNSRAAGLNGQTATLQANVALHRQEP